MPANLTLRYLQAEKEYRRATTAEEELACLQAMLRELPKHKGTDKLQADLKQRISKAKQAYEARKNAKKQGTGLRMPRQGAGRVVLLGGPNVGKSQFVQTTTRAEPEVAVYPFTTQKPSPAMMPFEDVFFQLVDTPPVTGDLFDADTESLVRGADLVLLLLDLGSDEGLSDGLAVTKRLAAGRTRLATESYLDDADIGVSYTRTILVPNKIDLPDAPLRWQMFQDEGLPRSHGKGGPSFPHALISAIEGTGIDELRQAVFDALEVVRVYTKLPTEKEPDFTNPFTIRRGETLAEVAQLIHKDIADHLKSARVWGSQVHGGTQVKPDYEPADKDVVELHT
jgi:ribosome-interacting GTPase 1